MVETILGYISAAFSAIPFSAATWAVLITLGMFVWLFSRASRDPNSPIKWEHLIIDSSNNRASPYKMGFLLGGLVATWIVITLTDKNKLTFDIFGLYLTYLLGGSSINTFVRSKETTQSNQSFSSRNAAYREEDELQPHIRRSNFDNTAIFASDGVTGEVRARAEDAKSSDCFGARPRTP